MSEKESNSKERFEWLKNSSFFKKLKQVKHIGLIITIIFVILLLLILFGNFDFLSFSKNQSTISTSVENTYSNSSEFVENMEKKLKSLISKIKGAGDIEVMVTLESGSSVLLASNDETIKTESGGTSTTSVSASPILIEQDGNKTPIILQEVLPTIKGVVVVSSGANDINVRLNILNAVQTLTGLSSGQIQILAGE